MQIKGNNSNFEACPEFTGKAVCVDVTPLRKQQSQFGERDVFKLVFEVDLEREDGNRYCVWSKNFTPSLNEKANFRKFLRAWLGRDLMPSELAEFDTETLLGKPAQLVVVHEQRDGQEYANIVACTPHKGGEPLRPTGKFVRRKDRDGEAGANGAEGDGGYRRVQGAGDAGPVDHAAVKVHVGRYKGIELRDLNPEAIQALVEKWLPEAKATPKPSADDKRLMAALEWWQTAARATAEDNVPY